MIDVRLLKTETTEEELGRYAHFTHTPFRSSIFEITSERAVGIARRCLALNHMSVFEFAHVTYRVTCPIFVARQLMRHRNGTFLEKSLRHIRPEALEFDALNDSMMAAYAAAFAAYNAEIERGARKEQARAVLPLGTPTQFIWRLSLRSLFNVFDQRLSAEAQEETREVVDLMYDLTAPHYPKIFEELEMHNAYHF